MCCEYAARVVSVVLLVVIKINSSTLTQQQVRDDIVDIHPILWLYWTQQACEEIFGTTEQLKLSTQQLSLSTFTEKKSVALEI